MTDRNVPGYNPAYENLLEHIATNGAVKTDRTGTGTLSVFGPQLRFDLAAGFPLITTKKVFTRGVIVELLWFLRGSTNVHWLTERGVHIWDEWADADGELGPVYGAQWRAWPTPDGRSIDQLADVVAALKANPDGRRHLVSAWNPAQVDQMALPACHCLFQFYVADDKLSCQLYQRSADMFLGVPFNIASYALLTHMVAAQVGLDVGEFIWTGGDTHIYSNHLEQVAAQLARTPRPFPTLELRPAASLFDYDLDDVRIVGYDPHPALSAPVAV